MLLAISLAACGNQKSDDLRDAAEQSDPAAAAVLQNEADSVEGAADVQQALQNAGNAAAASDTVPAQPQPQQQAKPHAPGDPVPPPKIDGSTS